MTKITVLMPVYNNDKKEVSEAISSILCQTYSDFELLIIDDGSESNLKKELKRIAIIDKRIRLVLNKTNTGLVNALNKGLELAKGEYIARMDADDISFPERLERQIYFMEDNNIDVLSSLAISKETKRIVPFSNPPINHNEIESTLPFECCIVHPTVMFKKEVVKKVGGYPNFKYAEDYALWNKLLFEVSQIKFHTLDKVLLYYKTSGKSQEYKKQQQEAYLKVREYIFRSCGIENYLCQNGNDIMNTPIKKIFEYVDVYIDKIKERFPDCDDDFLSRNSLRERIRICDKRNITSLKHMLKIWNLFFITKILYRRTFKCR